MFDEGATYFFLQLEHHSCSYGTDDLGSSALLTLFNVLQVMVAGSRHLNINKQTRDPVTDAGIHARS